MFNKISLSSTHVGLIILFLLVGGLVLFGMPSKSPAPGGEPCGNGIIDPGEECDDGNRIDGDGCSANCTIEKPPSDELCSPGYLKNHTGLWYPFVDDAEQLLADLNAKGSGGNSIRRAAQLYLNAWLLEEYGALPCEDFDD